MGDAGPAFGAELLPFALHGFTSSLGVEEEAVAAGAGGFVEPGTALGDGLRAAGEAVALAAAGETEGAPDGGGSAGGGGVVFG